MRHLPLILCVLVIGEAFGQDSECPQDMSGVQTTAGVTDSQGNPYQVTWNAADARTTIHFLHAAINYMYFEPAGQDLREEFIQYVRIRDASILLPACNTLGQCAEIEVYSRPIQWAGLVGLAVHAGFDVTARFNGQVATDFIPVDSHVYWNGIPVPHGASAGCLSNNQNSGVPTDSDNGDGNGDDGVDDDPFDIELDEELPEPDVSFPEGEVDIIDPDSEGDYPEWQEL